MPTVRPKAPDALPIADLQVNQRECLGCVRRMGECTRDDLEAHFGWKPATISRIIKPLLDAGFLISQSRMAPGQQRRRSFLRLNPELAYAVGIEVSFSHLRAALVDLGGRIIYRTDEFDHSKLSPEQTVKRIGRLLSDMRHQFGSHNVLGVGVSFIGSLPHPNDASCCFPETVTWEHFPMVDALREISDLPIEVHSDNITGVLAELRYGQGIRCENLLYVHMLHGIGLGIVTNGVIHTGASHLGGEFGHICVLPQGPYCFCGGTGCLEAVSSSWAILKQVRDRLSHGVHSRHLAQFDPASLTLADICQSVVTGDIFALDILNTAGEWLGVSVANIANVLDPEKIVLGGILAEGAAYASLIDSLKQAYQRNMHFYRSRQIELIASAFGTDSNLIGAAATVFERVLPAEPAQLIQSN